VKQLSKLGRHAETRVLFVTRRFPPSIGGMQTLAADVDRALRNVTDVELVALRYESTAHLAWFLPYALLRTLLALARGGVRRVVCGDAIVWATIAPAVTRANVKSTVMVHGLDLSFPNSFYQRWMRSSLPKAGRVVANSTATAAVAREHGVEAARLVVMNPGIRFGDVAPSDRVVARAELVRRFGLEDGTLIAVTLGRLVRRKGISWFVEHVMPQAPRELRYLVAGEGPMREEIEAAVARAGLADRVLLLGNVGDGLREVLLRGADLFVMPNVRVRGDMEGFGLVAAEAACRGALVLASGLEGIRDAVVAGATGILVEPERAEDFVEVLHTLANDRRELAALAGRYQREARERFSIDRMEEQLPDALGLGSG
jgi:phosphatidyl-myo-inositol dimannoside synthase